MAIMTGHKRMELEESVKEHKADEMSALFNMLMFKKQRDKGRDRNAAARSSVRL